MHKQENEKLAQDFDPPKKYPGLYCQHSQGFQLLQSKLFVIIQHFESQIKYLD